MQIETAVCNNIGGRKYNEDSVRCLIRGGVCAAAVADGLGGHGGGQIASALTAGTIVEAFTENPQMEPEAIRLILGRANAEVIKAQTPTQKMKSTGVSLFVKDSAATWAHAGDSRLYRFKDGVLAAQTLDHSVSQMAVFSGEITKEQIRGHADRNKVLRAFGDSEGFKADIAPLYTLDPGFHVFLLCTDGFWEYVWESEMESELTKAESPNDWLSAMTRKLAQRVPKDHDNFSAAAVFVKM